MRIEWPKDRLEAFRRALDACEDAEALASGEYVLDLYGEDPMTLEIDVSGSAVEVLAAETMAYDETLDGWYLAGVLEDVERVERALASLKP